MNRQHRHLYDTMWTNTGCPNNSYIPCSSYHVWKTKPWHFAVFMKILLKMAQHTALHFATISFKKMATVCTYEVWVIAFSHYASLLE